MTRWGISGGIHAIAGCRWWDSLVRFPMGKLANGEYYDSIRPFRGGALCPMGIIFLPAHCAGNQTGIWSPCLYLVRKNWEKCSSPHQNYRILPDPVIRTIVDFFWNPIAIVVSLNFHCFPIMSIFDKNLKFRINSNNNLWSSNNDFLNYSNQLCDPQIPPAGTVHYPHSLLCFPKWLLVNPFVSRGKIENYSFPIIQLYVLKWIHWIFLGLWLMFFLKWNMQ